MSDQEVTEVAKDVDGEKEDTSKEEELDESVEETTPQAVASQMMKNPQVLAAIQDRLGGMVGESSGYIESLPAVVKRRIKALKKLQFDANKIEGQFYNEVHQLEIRFAEQYAALYDKRKTIVTGEAEPTDSDCDWPSDIDDEDKEDEEVQLSGDTKAKLKIEDEENTDSKNNTDGTELDESTVGIPNFWLTIFKNIDILSDMIQDHDEPILLKLKDIRLKFLSEPIGFSLEFQFDDNDYFTNRILTKRYNLRTQPELTDSLMYEGPEIVGCEGCKIDWKPNKDVTMKVIKKKQKHKGRGTTRTISKTVPVDSFFNFFNPPKESEGEADDEMEALLQADFEIGHTIRERVIPRAVLYFTGEALEDDDEDDDEFDEDGGDEYDDDEMDQDYDPNKDKARCKQQ